MMVTPTLQSALKHSYGSLELECHLPKCKLHKQSDSSNIDKTH